MKESEQIMNRTAFSGDVLKVVARKQTEKGRIKALSTKQAVSEIFPNNEAVFEKITEVMFRKAGGRCKCGAPINRKYKRLQVLKKGKKENSYKFKCGGCGKTFSPLVQTPLKKCKMPFPEVIMLAWYLLNSPHGVTAAELEREFGWKYNTAWNMLMRMRLWFSMVVGNYKFDGGIVEVDEVFPKVTTGMGRKSGIQQVRGLGSHRIVPIFILTGNKTNPQTYGEVVDYANSATVKEIFDKRVTTSTTVFTDGKNIYNQLERNGYTKLSCNHGDKNYSTDGVHVNTAESANGYLKTALTRVHRGTGRKHLQKYVSELCFRYSNRYNSVHQALEQMFEALPGLNDNVIVNTNFFKRINENNEN